MFAWNILRHKNIWNLFVGYEGLLKELADLFEAKSRNKSFDLNRISLFKNRELWGQGTLVVNE